MRIKLKTKIWLTVLSVVLMFSFFSLFYYPAQQEKHLLNNYNTEVQNLCNTISLGVKIALTEENFEGVQTAMSFVKDDPRLLFVNLLVNDTTWNDDNTRFTLNETLLNTYPEEQKKDQKSYAAHSIIKKRSPFSTELMTGNIELGVTTDKIQMDKKKIRSTSLFVSAGVLLIGILIGFWLSRNISIPVLALRDAAIKVGRGDLSQRVEIASGDEIGELAIAFNKMVEDLAKARKELSEANLNLASSNDALNATLENLKAAHEQLVQSEKMASLGQLTAGIAHEINNPINFVSANIQPLKDDIADVLSIVALYEKVAIKKGIENEFSEVEEFKKKTQIDQTLKEIDNLLKGIEEGAMRTSEIVKGLRNFSRLDQKVLLKANMNESLGSTLTLLHSSYKNRIEVEKQFGDIPEIDCYPGQVNQVFMNILSNAIQAIPEKGTIIIKTWQENEDVRISIKDNGSGMPEKVRKKIFDPFFTTKDVGKGTGLGLSISYGIIQKHNGEIEVFSTPGEGTEFIIRMPISHQTIS